MGWFVGNCALSSIVLEAGIILNLGEELNHVRSRMH